MNDVQYLLGNTLLYLKHLPVYSALTHCPTLTHICVIELGQIERSGVSINMQLER